jgi:hypothetical protein
MELPFYLRILPPEALEILAYFRRQGSNIAHADTMLNATQLSERGFGKAIRRLVTKGYLVLDGDQRYRLTEHGQRAVDDLPASMAGRAPAINEPEAEEPVIEHIPIDSSDNFDSLFESSADDDTVIDLNDLFGEMRNEPVNAARFLDPTSDSNDAALDSLFGADDDSEDDEDDDLFAELGAEDEAAFDDLFGGDDEEDAAPLPTSTTTTAATFSDDDVFADFEDLFGDMDEVEAGDEAKVPQAQAAPVSDETAEDEPASATVNDEALTLTLTDNADALTEALPQVVVTPMTPTEPPTDLLDTSTDNVDLFEWLEVDSDSVSEEGFDLWGTSASDEDIVLEAAEEEPTEEPVTIAAQRTVARRLVVSLPQPLLAEQPAHVTVGILPGDAAEISEPVPLVVRLAVVNGTPAYAHDLPLLLTNGLTRQDTTIIPGRFQQVRLRLQVYQVSDDEATLCGGMYVDADVVEDADSQDAVAFGADAHFVLTN